MLPGETKPYKQPWEPPMAEPAQAEATVPASVANGELHWTFSAALASLTRHGHLAPPPVREALAALRAEDRRLSEYGHRRTSMRASHTETHVTLAHVTSCRAASVGEV
ncbi:hypothetical protein J7E96_13205 [Streptomyces sp. ISL-96]|uniref:hypothetical protein n=1 Tax=Streptomyces sp. ISL-96 TaxID=2819191 RepID=UPI001BE9A961|nr:hypothetical protein [Streptomyces sp. ISL-96]MBT2489458.1 hypothetical protein [Streptomyces sp. ISL-96]